MGLWLALLKRSPFLQTCATLASFQIGGKVPESSDFQKRCFRIGDSGVDMFYLVRACRVMRIQVVLNTFGCDCYVQHGSVCISTFLSFHVTKGAEAVSRLQTKNRLELFIKNSGFRGVVLMDRIVFAQRCNRGRILFGMLRSVKSFFVLGLEVRSFETTSRISSR